MTAKLILPAILIVAFSVSQAQTSGVKKHITTNGISKKSTTRRMAPAPERMYGTPTSITQITDLPAGSTSYETVKSLIENYNVPITFADNNFHGKEGLKRGDFIVSLNGAYNFIKKSAVDAGLDTSLVNTYDRNKSYITSVRDIKDLSPESVYYTATQSLLEKWGVAAPFTKAKMLNANSPVSETEVYDILKVTLGYVSGGANSLNASISRDKFAAALNNAIAQNVSIVNSIHSMRQAAADDERRRLQDSVNTAETIRKQAIAKEIELKRMEAQKKEAEARQKLKDKNK